MQGMPIIDVDPRMKSRQFAAVGSTPTSPKRVKKFLTDKDLTYYRAESISSQMGGASTHIQTNRENSMPIYNVNAPKIVL